MVLLITFQVTFFKITQGYTVKNQIKKLSNTVKILQILKALLLQTHWINLFCRTLSLCVSKSQFIITFLKLLTINITPVNQIYGSQSQSSRKFILSLLTYHTQTHGFGQTYYSNFSCLRLQKSVIWGYLKLKWTFRIFHGQYCLSIIH